MKVISQQVILIPNAVFLAPIHSLTLATIAWHQPLMIMLVALKLRNVFQSQELLPASLGLREEVDLERGLCM